MKKSAGPGHGSSTVFIKKCEDYDREKIRQLVREGMKALKYTPGGNVFMKPNVVFAMGAKYGNTAYTDTSVLGASILAAAEFDTVKRIDVGENTAVGFPTRYCYKQAGYYRELRSVKKKAGKPVSIYCIDEYPRDRMFVGGAVHDVLRVSRPMARSDTKIYLPKLKCHCVTTMTGAVKLNIGICCDDERSIRHDFLLNEKIVDLLAVGYPDFIVMDAVDVGVGNEAVPTPRRLGLVIMGTNPLAVDIVGSRLLGYNVDEVPYLKKAVERGYGPGSLREIELQGDITSVRQLDNHAKCILPYNDEYTRWQDVNRDLKKLSSPIELHHGETSGAESGRCETGCVMGVKMYMGFMEKFAGQEAFAKARPSAIIIGDVKKKVDARGGTAFLTGTCARADIVNAKKIIRIDRCFTTASEMTQSMPAKMGLPNPYLSPSLMGALVKNVLTAAVVKTVRLKYFQDVGYFFSKSLMKKI